MQPLNTEKFKLILGEVTRWATVRSDITAVALVGSWARGTARIDSDIDLMLLTHSPLLFRQSEHWADEIKWSIIDAKIDRWEDKDYGLVWSRHIYLDDETKIEFSFGLSSWASVDPIDIGTFRVVNDGCQVLYDPEYMLSKLIDAIQPTQTTPLLKN
jgi:uncharacterized protein